MKRNIKLFTAIFAVLLVAGASIFYACEKDNNVSNIDNNLTKEVSFVAKNYGETCVQVDVLRDENGNAHFVIKDVANDPEVAVSCIIPEALNIPTQKTKNGEGVVSEIPNDAIYWLVPLDGHDPIKFEPTKDAKTASTGTVERKCHCTEWLTTGSDKCDPKRTGANSWECELKSGCQKCTMVISTTIDGKTTVTRKYYTKNGEVTTTLPITPVSTFASTCYLVQSVSITIGNFRYE